MRSRAWRVAHREEEKARHRAWKAANPDKVKAGSVAYYAENAADVKAKVAARRAENPEKYNAANAVWRANNPDQQRRNNAKRRARKRNAPGGHYTAVERKALFDAFGGKCAYCPAEAEHVDHVQPLARGGSNEIANLVPACAACNLSKGPKTFEEFATSRVQAIVREWLARCARGNRNNSGR